MNALQMSLYLIGRDEFRIKCSTYEKENLDLSERVSRTEKFKIKAIEAHLLDVKV